MDPKDVIAIDTVAMPWEERYQAALGKSNFRKLLLQDPDTGMEIRLLRLPGAGSRPPGIPTTAPTACTCSKAPLSRRPDLRPRFVWFPVGMLMEHGAPADSDVVMLFITNKKFDIHSSKSRGKSLQPEDGVQDPLHLLHEVRVRHLVLVDELHRPDLQLHALPTAPPAEG